MPLHVRSLAINIAVICFFCIAVIGWFNDHAEIKDDEIVLAAG